ncbi:MULTISPECIES: MgtC/SapB family protein [Bacillaceae]|uniref:Methyltransferase n=2 Tax=Bacillus infantis TaxID=324767 RepID=U5LEX8_9BACI|nr:MULTISPECIES: MgtC/SapB family protein [Bacillus]OXT15545.1 methyltransferase [Bacillus sp. OG2]AGX05968.1 methyltransferase [Bacillus infantis NRRL B-14911]EAR64121.1 SapB [Bacillus sp. NRRL B-14911]MCA1033978.1 MgtC/SapB family protein [Bacillus infantis]MCP1160220.1 MgtC/SapB family protein [Bacillus infantis]
MEEMFYLVIKNDVIMKLGFAALAGLVIGLERELKGKPLGLKTCLIVSVMACLLTIVSYESAFLYSKEYSRPMDPGRIPSYVISGIGFLGAGVILRRGNEAISGLTTAALVLASAGIGITIGAGFYIEALLGVIFIIIGVKIIPALFERIGPKKLKEKEIRVKLYIEKCTDLTTLMKEIKSKKLGIKRVRVKEEADDILINCVITTTRSMYTTDVYYTMKSLIGVIAAEVESGE